MLRTRWRIPRGSPNAVAFDWPRLGEPRGFDGVHLRCHLGADTICLARFGARKTGLDLSPCSNEHARRIAAENKVPVDYVVSGVYQAVGALESGRIDPVYTGIGALCWLPDIRRWERTTRTGNSSRG